MKKLIISNSLEAGMNEHLLKPINAKMLYTEIYQYCKIGGKS